MYVYVNVSLYSWACINVSVRSICMYVSVIVCHAWVHEAENRANKMRTWQQASVCHRPFLQTELARVYGNDAHIYIHTHCVYRFTLLTVSRGTASLIFTYTHIYTHIYRFTYLTAFHMIAPLICIHIYLYMHIHIHTYAYTDLYILRPQVRCGVPRTLRFLAVQQLACGVQNVRFLAWMSFLHNTCVCGKQKKR
jgi:hypothetical protein